MYQTLDGNCLLNLMAEAGARPQDRQNLPGLVNGDETGVLLSSARLV